MAMETEEFSFPAITENSPSGFIDSPPLWRSSSASLPSSFQHDHEEKDEIMNEEEREKSRKMFEDERSDKEEEKMDMLWEDFNFSEELLLYRSCDSSPDFCALSRDVVHQLGCGPAIGLSKGRGGGARGGGGSTTAIFSGRRRSVVSFVSVLKRLFLLHNSLRSRNHKRQLL